MAAVSRQVYLALFYDAQLDLKAMDWCSRATLAIIGTLVPLAQVQEPGGSCGEAAGGGGLEPMTKRPVRRYTVDGKLMTPDDLRRLHDYLADLDTIAIISDEMRVVDESEWPEFIHKLPPRRWSLEAPISVAPSASSSRTTKASITSGVRAAMAGSIAAILAKCSSTKGLAAPGAGSTAMTGAQFEIRIDGTRRTYRDRKDYAMEAARFLKSKNLHSMVEVKDLQSGDVTAVANRPGWMMPGPGSVSRIFRKQVTSALRQAMRQDEASFSYRAKQCTDQGPRWGEGEGAIV
jgi:hypothetical protein